MDDEETGEIGEEDRESPPATDPSVLPRLSVPSLDERLLLRAISSRPSISGWTARSLYMRSALGRIVP